jgi:hypothetical protein
MATANNMAPRITKTIESQKAICRTSPEARPIALKESDGMLYSQQERDEMTPYLYNTSFSSHVSY